MQHFPAKEHLKRTLEINLLYLYSMNNKICILKPKSITYTTPFQILKMRLNY